MSNGGLVDSGDRLISVNEKSLEGLSHTTVVDILQNSPDDVTLVVSQPKERLYKGKNQGYRYNFCFHVHLVRIDPDFYPKPFLFQQNLLEDIHPTSTGLHLSPLTLLRNKNWTLIPPQKSMQEQEAPALYSKVLAYSHLTHHQLNRTLPSVLKTLRRALWLKPTKPLVEFSNT